MSIRTVRQTSTLIAGLLSTLAFGAGVSTAASTSSCAAVSSWIQDFEKDPFAKVTEFLQEVSVIVNALHSAWDVISPLLPAAAAQTGSQEFSTAMTAISTAQGDLLDALQAARLANQALPPDVSPFVQRIKGAITAAILVLDKYPSSGKVGVGAGGGPVTFEPSPALLQAKARSQRLNLQPNSLQ